MKEKFITKKIEGQQLENREKEPRLEKILLLIRHPSYKWINRLLDQAEIEGKDIEFYTPVDIEGLKMTRKLAEYLSGYLSENLPQVLKEKTLDKKFTVYTSPIKRAKSEANTISENLKLFHLENPKIPIPANNKPIEIDYFSEVPWTKRKKYAEMLVNEAHQKRMHVLEVWFKKEPKKVVKRLNEQLVRVEKGLQILDQSKTPVDIVFTHRLNLALMLWFIEQKQESKKDLMVTEKDLSHILELSRQIAFTSINEIRQFRDENGRKYWIVHSTSKAPHLDKKPELKKGVF